MPERQVWNLEFLNNLIATTPDKKKAKEPRHPGKRSTSPREIRQRKIDAAKQPRIKVPQDHWVRTHKEFLRWKKTPEFDKWKRKQFLKQGGTCYYCDLPLYGGVRGNTEHVIPKILGGGNKPANLVLACWKCNKDKYTTLLSRKEREALKVKNKMKRGTYLETRARIKTETDVAYELRDMFRE